MQTADSESIDSVVPLFDVVISMPPGAKLETIQQLAETEAGLPPDRVERLIKVLRSTPNAKVGAAVTFERAEEEKARFTKAGLLVEVTPLLTVQTVTAGSFDGLDGCPACGKRSVMPKNRQCPSCGVYIDKLTDEYLLRKKVMQQELGAIEFQKNQSAKNTDKNSRESVEASIRAQVRDELEKKYGISKGGFFKGNAGLLIGGTLAIVMGLLYMGEKGVTIGGMSLPWGKKETPPGTMSASSLQQASAGASAAGGTDAGASAAGTSAGAAGAATELTGDADVDDMLIQAAAGKKAGGKTLTMEEALAASRTLAKSVGNTTAESALAGASVGGPGGAADAKAGSAAAAGGVGTAAGNAQTDAAAADTVPKQTKQLFTAEFASLLAELGQVARSREVLKALAGGINPATDAPVASALRTAQLRLQAWSTLRMDGGQARQAAEDLKAKTQAITNAQERTQLQGQMAVVLSRNPLLPPEVPRQFLSLGAESLKAIGGAQTNSTLGDLAVSMAEVFLHETTARAKAGGWNKAKASAIQIEDLLKQAPDAWAQSRLYAVDYQAKLQTGQTDKAAKSLESALALAGKNSNLLERAIWLRSIAQLSDASTHEQFEAMTTSLQNQLNAKSGIEKARGLTELSLLHAAAGLPGKSAQLRSLAQATPGLSAADSVAINTDLIVRSDMAMAKMLHGLGRYAEAEAVLQRIGGYLF